MYLKHLFYFNKDKNMSFIAFLVEECKRSVKDAFVTRSTKILRVFKLNANNINKKFRK